MSTHTADELRQLLLPVASAHVSTSYLQAARDDLRNSQAPDLSSKQRDRYLERAMRSALFAEQDMHGAMGRWREYNDRLSRVIAVLAEQEETA